MGGVVVWSRGGDVVAVNSWQSRFGIVHIVVLGGNKHENDPEAGSPNTYVGRTPVTGFRLAVQEGRLTPGGQAPARPSPQRCLRLLPGYTPYACRRHQQITDID